MASIRTMYRVLAEQGETQERRNQRLPQVHTKPSLTTTAPNQVWTWDITKLATTVVGVFLHAYVIIDLFSRYVVGWMVAGKECKHLAAQLFAETIARHGVEPGLTLHSDRGPAMKSDTLAQLLATLGVQRSFSRPHVSDDNAFSEAGFKTLKYQPDYPGRFAGELHARGWLEPFFGWHNDEHHHSNLALFTPADVFFGRVEQVRNVRQAAPHRFLILAVSFALTHFGCWDTASTNCFGSSSRTWIPTSTLMVASVREALALLRASLRPSRICGSRVASTRRAIARKSSPIPPRSNSGSKFFVFLPMPGDRG